MIAIWRSKVSRGAEPVHRISCFEVLFRTFRGQTSNRWSRIIVGICNHPTLDFSICIFWLATVNTKSVEYRKYVPFNCHQVRSLQHEMISLLFQQPLNWRWISHLCTGKKTAWVGILWTVVFLHENYWSDHVLRLAPRFIAAWPGPVKLSCFLLPFACKCSCMRFSNWIFLLPFACKCSCMRLSNWMGYHGLSTGLIA